jgi:hypothetical protein
MRLDCNILPVMVWAKVEGFVAGRTGSTAKTKADGFGPNQPGPPVEPRFCETGKVRPAGFVCLSICELQIDGQGFRPAGTRGVEPLERWNPIALRASPTGLPRRPGNRMIQSNLISI